MVLKVLVKIREIYLAVKLFLPILSAKLDEHIWQLKVLDPKNA